MTRLVLTVGNSLMGDDAAGPLLARALQAGPAAGWAVLDGGQAPENLLHRVRAIDPERVLVVDATDMDLEPGAVRLIDTDRLDDPFLMSTHTLPLVYLIESLRESTARVDLLGIQPRLVAFGCPVSPEVRQAVAAVHMTLQQQADPDWERL